MFQGGSSPFLDPLVSRRDTNRLTMLAILATMPPISSSNVVVRASKIYHTHIKSLWGNITETLGTIDMFQQRESLLSPFPETRIHLLIKTLKLSLQIIETELSLLHRPMDIAKILDRQYKNFKQECDNQLTYNCTLENVPGVMERLRSRGLVANPPIHPTISNAQKQKSTLLWSWKASQFSLVNLVSFPASQQLLQDEQKRLAAEETKIKSELCKYESLLQQAITQSFLPLQPEQQWRVGECCRCTVRVFSCIPPDAQLLCPACARLEIIAALS